MKSFLTSIFVVFVSFQFSYAQQIEQYLPPNPIAIVHIKPAIVQSKVDMAELRKLPLVENVMSGLQSMMPLGAAGAETLSFADLGLDPNKEMYFYANREEDGMVTALLLNVLDKKIFTKRILESDFETKEMKSGNFTTFMNKEQFISIGDGMAIIGMLMKTPEPYDPYSDMNWEEEEWLEELEDAEEEEVLEEVLEEVVEEELEDVLEQSPEEEMPVIGEDEEELIFEEVEVEFEDETPDEETYKYQNESPKLNLEWLDEKLMKSILPTGGLNIAKKAKLAKGKGVLTAWIDYGEMMSTISDMAGVGDIGGGMVKDLYGSMYKDMDAFLDMQFNDGEMVLVSDYGYPKSLTRGLDLTKAKVNSKFRKYIKGDNLLGVYSMALNTEAYGNIIKETMLNAMDAIPETMGLGKDLAPLLGVIIDEEAIYNFFKGDLVVAFTGMNIFEKTEITYEYDEDFNPIEKESIVESKLPEFTAMMTVGDKANMLRILNVGKKIGVMESYGNYFLVKAPIGFDLFVAMENDILIISNDAQLVTQNLSSGYGSNKIGRSEWKNIKKNAMHFYWDLPQTLNMASEFGMPLGEETINMSRESIKEIVWNTPRKQGNNMSSVMKVSFVNEKENSLKLILNFFNEMFFPNNERTSM